MFLPTQKKSWCTEGYLEKLAKSNAKKSGTELTNEHLTVLRDIFMARRNLLLTGGAGTGKSSLLLNHIVPVFNDLGVRFAITASTGVAASLLAGKTVHSWSGCGLGPAWGFERDALSFSEEERDEKIKDTIQAWIDKPGGWKSAIRNRICNTDVLVIDEISMLPGESYMRYMDMFFRAISGIHKPFGGIQIICIGDFMQLPPVQTSQHGIVDWAFKSRTWLEADFIPRQLTKTFRQADGEFVDLLNNIRVGKPPTQAQWDVLGKQVVDTAENLDVTFLTPFNKTADVRNRKKLLEINGVQRVMSASYSILPHQLYGNMTRDVVLKQLRKAGRTRETLHLKVGCRVMMLKNSEISGYHNGSQGYVTRFVYAIPDGVTYQEVLDTPELCADDKIVGIEVLLDALDSLPADWDILEDDKKLEARTVIVHRDISTRGNHEPEDEMIHIKQEGSDEVKELPKWPRRYQFPIVQSDALTIHKSQGSSLDCAELDLDAVFAPGSAYVALSRLRSVEGLTLRSIYLPVLVDEEAKNFTNSIPPIE